MKHNLWSQFPTFCHKAVTEVICWHSLPLVSLLPQRACAPALSPNSLHQSRLSLHPRLGVSNRPVLISRLSCPVMGKWERDAAVWKAVKKLRSAGKLRSPPSPRIGPLRGATESPSCGCWVAQKAHSDGEKGMDASAPSVSTFVWFRSHHLNCSFGIFLYCYPRPDQWASVWIVVDFFSCFIPARTVDLMHNVFIRESAAGSGDVVGNI